MSGELALRCPACEAPAQADDRFCEACGASMAAAAPAAPAATAADCHACAAAADAIDADGYCTSCGVRRRAARAELDHVLVAAVSEQGRSHRRNEDAFHIERVGDAAAVAVVCDGISTAAAGNAAARAAAAAAAAVLADGVRCGAALTEATRAAVDAARGAVERVPATGRAAALALPSCTLVCAAWRDHEIVVGWVGDSRAYWLAPGDARQLTVDHSWAAEQIAEGLLSAEEAFSDRRSHAITRWVGADAPPEAPQLTSLTAASPGLLVLCSDGLWNEAPTASELAGLAAALGPAPTPAAVAHRLADTAMARGARDDVTVAVIDIQPPEGNGP